MRKKEYGGRGKFFFNAIPQYVCHSKAEICNIMLTR